MGATGMLNGKTVLVTGASRGIGAAIADRLAREGAYVTGTATSTAGAARVSARFAENAVAGEGQVLDITSSESVGALGEHFAKHGPDILVNNAGITRDNLLMRMKEEEWQQVVATNLGGVFRITRLLVRPMLKRRWGRVISIGSVVAASGNPGQANYSAAKAGIEGFTRSLALEVASRGITANVVAPGFIATDMTASLTAGQKEALAGRIPMARLGTGADVAAAVLYLASEAAGYVTGQTLHVNGGLRCG